jgi:phosphoenolpyruvate synthase/pyruvate phosphate dikinase
LAFEQIRLPHVWHGVPQPITTVPSPASEDVQELHGIGVSVGVAEGVVRVIVDLDDAEIDDGTVMVCKATDPSWASLFPLAEAVVTDVRSAMSHAAIVCRELGLPCVANTRTGTAQLRDGMRVRVDGSAGTVLVIGDS